MAGLYVDHYRPWPDWIVGSLEEIGRIHNCQVGTYPGHADRDHGDQTGQFAADLWLYGNSRDRHDDVLTWFRRNAVRIGGMYIITWGRIWSVDRADEGVREYRGDDPHRDHVHISYRDEAPEGEDMPTAREIADEVSKQFSEVWLSDEVRIIEHGGVKITPGGSFRTVLDDLDGIKDRQARIEAKLDELIAGHAPTTPPASTV